MGDGDHFEQITCVFIFILIYQAFIAYYKEISMSYGRIVENNVSLITPDKGLFIN